MKTYEQQIACSHGPLARAGVGAAAHRPGVPAFLPHGPAARGHNGLALCLILLLLLAPFCRADGPLITRLVPALGWDIKKQGGFPVSLVSDSAGNIWVGTEGNGLWEYDHVKKTWTRFTTKDGLGDDTVYALAIDQQNRIWAGHLNHGVSVYNGDKWQNYGLLDGPIGDRIFAIAVSPKDGDVWMASDMGLARYSEKRRDWDYYTRASGLPSDQIQAIAFDAKANLYAGTQCDGIAIAGPNDNYTRWSKITAAEPLGPKPEGEGLGSNLINGLHTVPVNGQTPMVLAFSPTGLSAISDTNHVMYTRGADWREFTPGPYDENLPPDDDRPLEDWVTALSNSGFRVWLGYRKHGIQQISWNNQGVEVRANVKEPGAAIIRAILAPPDQPPLVAAYDATSGGLLTLANAPPENPGTTGSPAPSPAQLSAVNVHPPLPAPAPPPMPDDAKALSAPLAKITEALVPGEAYYVGDDWVTEGDWIGRYGSAYAKLCGMADGDQDYALQAGYQVRLQVGVNHAPNAAGPVSFHDDDSSTDLRSLYDPTLGHRRDAEENDFSDNAKVYPESYNGPDLWARVTVPEGVHGLTLYFLNNDAHSSGGAKYRDYDVSIVPGYPDDNQAAAAPPIARTRVTDFWGGVYKEFFVCGPASFVVRIGRNRSFGTRLQGVFLDRVTLTGAMDIPNPLPGFTNPYGAPDEPDSYQPTPLTDAAVQLWNKLDDDLGMRAVPLQIPLRMWCYRAAVAGKAPAPLLERWRWIICIWTPDDRKKFDEAMKAAFGAKDK